MWGFAVGLVVSMIMLLGPAHAQDDDIPATVEALRTEVAGIETTLAELETQIAGPDSAEEMPVPTPTAADETPVRTGGDGSSLSSPLAMGEAGRVGDYEITVIRVNSDAEAIVLAENQFNEPAQFGKTMVMVTLEMTYVGNETGTVFWDLTYAVVAGGLAYTDIDDEASCGSEPDGLLDAPEMYPSSTVEVNVCWQVPSAETSSVVMALEPLFSFSEDEQVFFSLSD
jgi:hypothetical protein